MSKSSSLEDTEVMAHKGPHEFNQDFHWERPAGPFQRISDEQVDQYFRNGYFVIEDAFDEAKIAEMTAEADPVEERISKALGRRVPQAGFTIASNLVLRSEKMRHICADGLLADVARDLIGPRPRIYWEQAVYKEPGVSGVFPWHQDNGKTYVDPQHYITCWIALTDTDEDSGCLAVAAGLHTLGTLRHWLSDSGWVCLDEDPAEVVPVPLKAGSVAVFSSVTTHMTYPNNGATTRKAYVVQYIPDGAAAVERSDDGSLLTIPQNVPDRQFVI